MPVKALARRPTSSRRVRSPAASGPQPARPDPSRVRNVAPLRTDEADMAGVAYVPCLSAWCRWCLWCSGSGVASEGRRPTGRGRGS